MTRHGNSTQTKTRHTNVETEPRQRHEKPRLETRQMSQGLVRSVDPWPWTRWSCGISL